MTDINRLVLEINQGCPRGYGFTLQQTSYDEETETTSLIPVDLTGLTIMLEVKLSPYVGVKPIIKKVITETENDDGVISEPLEGQFQFQFTMKDTTKIPPGEYPMVVTMIDNDTYTNIGGVGNNNPIFRVCHQ